MKDIKAPAMRTERRIFLLLTKEIPSLKEEM
jgi:hypothetical protein